MSKGVYNQLERLTKKIEDNTASLQDYQQYESILRKGGLTHDYIFSYLQKAGFNSWVDFVKARKNIEYKERTLPVAIGGIIGIGVGLLLMGVFSKED